MVTTETTYLKTWEESRLIIITLSLRTWEEIELGEEIIGWRQGRS